ncbi:hypothetical protein D0Z00_000729 [Geotrichum galactomycetum]|uniref:Uncharacterized protein n=1 Tax=Geotrichum galactomycetum TaxID=27317 RepID=A0ACB6V978_9ASCO|nr:hypothetical protein D0Z00_000729 [Geotrichum candidum]
MAGDGLEKVTEIPVEFIKEGTTFLNRCTKPDGSEFIKIIRAVGVGFIVMGAIGYIVKLIGLDGKEINPYIPRYISNAPWYLEKSDDYLQHQRSTKEVIKGEWYDRGNHSTQKNVPVKFRKGACTNCGAMTHNAKECLERPRKVGAKYSGLDLRADDNIQDIKTTWDSKRDRWNGYDADEYKGVVREFEHEQQIKEQAEEEERLRKIRLGLTDATPSGGDGDAADDGDPDKKLTTRTLRVREDKAQYLSDLSEDSAVFNPKSRTLRSEAAGSINDRGLFVRKLTDEAEAHSALREYADAAAERGEIVNLESGPTEAVLRLKQRRVQEEAAANKLRRDLLDKYGGEEYLDQKKRPREALEAPVEEYHEYTATGELKKPKLDNKPEEDVKSGGPQESKQDVYAKSKYQEDIYPGNHTSVWGSYWKDGKWGFNCCYSLVRQSYCLGTKGREINNKPKE